MNNYLTHAQWEAYDHALKQCDGDEACIASVHSWAENQSLENEYKFLTCRERGDCALIAAEVKAAEQERSLFEIGSILTTELQNQAYYAAVNLPYSYGYRDTGYTGTDLEFTEFRDRFCQSGSNADCVRTFEIVEDIRQSGDVQTQLGAFSVLMSAGALAVTGCGGLAGCALFLVDGAMSVDQLETGLDNIVATDAAEQTNYVQLLTAAGLDEETAQSVEFWTGVGLVGTSVATIAVSFPDVAKTLDNVSSGGAPNSVGKPIKQYPDGSFRTADGKFASQGGLPSPGTKSAQEYTQFLRDKGFDVVGEELTVKAAVGNRRYDAVVRTDKGELWGIEYKSGSATKTPQQNFNDMYVNQFGADGVGQLAGEKVVGSITIYLP